MFFSCQNNLSQDIYFFLYNGLLKESSIWLSKLHLCCSFPHSVLPMNYWKMHRVKLLLSKN